MTAQNDTDWSRCYYIHFSIEILLRDLKLCFHIREHSTKSSRNIRTHFIRTLFPSGDVEVGRHNRDRDIRTDQARSKIKYLQHIAVMKFLVFRSYTEESLGRTETAFNGYDYLFLVLRESFHRV